MGVDWVIYVFIMELFYFLMVVKLLCGFVEFEKFNMLLFGK